MMMRRTVALALLVMLSLCSLARAQFMGGAPRATAEVFLNTDNLQPGQQAIAVVVVEIEDNYHAQSSQPLDESLIPFVVTMKGGDSVTVGESLYPRGHIEDVEALGGKLSVFDGRVLTFVPIEIAKDAKPGEVTLSVNVDLQICNDTMCDPPSTLTTSIKTNIVSAGTPQKATNETTFAKFDSLKWLNKHPTASAGSTTGPTTQQAATGTPTWVKYTPDALAAARATGKPVVLKFTAAWCVNCHVVERRVFADAATLEELGKRGVTLIKVDLTQDGAPGSDILAKYNPSRSIPFTAVYFPGSDEPGMLTGIYSSADLIAKLDDAGKTKTSVTTFFGYELSTAPLPLKLLAAMAVGLVLNAVPCVLPVLPLKAMSFYEDAGHSRGRSLINGAVFSLGIVATFGALALFVITSGKLWGTLISHPITAGVLGIVLLVAAAQAFGLFEIVLPRAVTNLEIANERYASGGNGLNYGVVRREPSTTRLLAGNFFGGMLIAVLSTPCTVGIFAAVIAIALSAGALLGSLILMFVGVGMALPWLALSGFPEITRRFPRTGPWPSIVKQMMGFLLIGTAIFFVQPVLPEAWRGSVMWWMIFACVAASAIFLMTRTVQVAPRARPLAIASVVSLVWVGCGLALTLALAS